MSDDSPAAVTWRFLPMGEAALLVEGAGTITLVNRYALALAHELDARALPGVCSVVPAIQSLLVRFDPLVWSHEQIQDQIRAWLEQVQPLPAAPARVVTIPVRYGGKAGPDLEEVAQILGLTPRELIARHTSRVYRVMMIGFAPGFPYIGPLPDRLNVPRRATPRVAVPAGSVAIAVGLTGIYPARLPGGWHLIGHTDLPMFDPSASPPSTLMPGDGVQFVPLPEGLLP